MWSEEDETLIRETLIGFDPEFKNVIGKGFYYIQMPSNDTRFYMRYQKTFLEHAFRDVSSKNSLMLDYGTGVGSFMLYMWKHGFTNMVGADADEHRLKACGILLKTFNCPFKTYLCAYEGIYNIGGQYDVIFMNDYLYAKSIKLPEVIKSVHKALSRYGLWFFDLLEYEGHMIPDARNYYVETDIMRALENKFQLVETISHYSGESKKTLYVARKI